MEARLLLRERNAAESPSEGDPAIMAAAPRGNIPALIRGAPLAACAARSVQTFPRGKQEEKSKLFILLERIEQGRAGNPRAPPRHTLAVLAPLYTRGNFHKKRQPLQDEKVAIICIC